MRRCGDYVAATEASIKGLKIGVPSSFYVDDLDADVAKILDNTIAVLKREGADIVKVDLPDQRQLAAACQLVLAVEAAAFHKRWLIERPQDYGPQVLMRLQNGLAIPGVLYLETMRWRGQALAAHNAATSGVDAVLAPVAPLAAPTIAESDVGNGPDAAGVAPARDALHPADQLSRPAVAGDSRRLHAEGPAGRHAADRPLVRRSNAAHHRRRLPARHRFPRQGAAIAFSLTCSQAFERLWPRRNGQRSNRGAGRFLESSGRPFVDSLDGARRRNARVNRGNFHGPVQ